jgi:hypothetical protein
MWLLQLPNILLPLLFHFLLFLKHCAVLELSFPGSSDTPVLTSCLPLQQHLTQSPHLLLAHLGFVGWHSHFRYQDICLFSIKHLLECLYTSCSCFLAIMFLTELIALCFHSFLVVHQPRLEFKNILLHVYIQRTYFSACHKVGSWWTCRMKCVNKWIASRIALKQTNKKTPPVCVLDSTHIHTLQYFLGFYHIALPWEIKQFFFCIN